jgi:hypothetical protein
MVRNIFLIGGYAGSGKDTLADIVSCSFLYFKRFAFADELKTFTAEKHGFNKILCYSQQSKKQIVYSDLTVRDLLIKEALFKRKQDPDIWVNKVIDKIKLRCDVNSSVVIPDFRYPNEYARLKSVFPEDNIITVSVKRYAKSSINDPSETSLDTFKFDKIINNDTDLKTFRYNVLMYFNEVLP